MEPSRGGAADACRVVRRPLPRTRVRRRLKGTRVGAAVEDEVLAGDVAGLGAADERTHLAELRRGAEASRGILGLALPGDLLDRLAASLRLGRDVGTQPIRVEGARQDIVDRDVVRDRLAR